MSVRVHEFLVDSQPGSSVNKASPWMYISNGMYLNDEMIVSFPPSLVPKRVPKDHRIPHRSHGISRPIRGHVFVLLDGRRPGYMGGVL